MFKYAEGQRQIDRRRDGSLAFKGIVAKRKKKGEINKGDVVHENVEQWICLRGARGERKGRF